MSAFKLHHTKFYTRHSQNDAGHPHCYRCDEILANGNRVWVALTPTGFALPNTVLSRVDAHGEVLATNQSDTVLMGATCALKAIAGK